VLAEADASGLSVERFAASAGLDAKRLYRWRRRLQDAERPAFVEITAPVAPMPVGGVSFEVLLGERRRVRVAAGFDADELRRLVEALEDPSAC
jgi:hypothetical protein